MALTVNSYSIYPSFSICCPYLFVFHLQHSKDGADSVILNLCLSFFNYTLSLSYIRSIFINRFNVPDYLQMVKAKF